MNAGGGVELDGWLEKVQGLLWAFYPGQEGGTAIVETLFGLQNPSGKLPFTMAKDYNDHPSSPFYKINEGGKTPYSEGLFMGYRGFDAKSIEPAFPFGYGLSYTTFVYEKPELVRSKDGNLLVHFVVKNTGNTAGDEIAQVYVAPPQGHGRPPQKLEGFSRLSIAPGAEQRATVLLPPRAFAYWEDGWKIPAGRYTLYIGSSSRQRNLELSVELPETELGRN
jgi:beta-glucosidase